MKDLLVYLPPANRGLPCLDYAISLASRLRAHLEGVAFTFLPELSGIYATMPSDFYATVQKQSEVEAAGAQQQFVSRAAAADIRSSVSSYTATAVDAERIFGRAARCHDLAIVPQIDPENAAFFSLKLDDTMFLSGRPALFVPTIHRGPAALDRILVCWNGDRWAARAAADALPLMKLAKRVDVLQIEVSNNIHPECDAAELVKHLVWHGIATETHSFRDENSDIGAAILSFAADRKSTLIVMGGYGHSRAREILFGGATREVLRTMTVPVLLSH